MGENGAVVGRSKHDPPPAGIWEYLLLFLFTGVIAALLCLLIYRNGQNSPIGWVLAVILFLPVSLMCMRILPRYKTILQMVFRLLDHIVNAWENRRRKIG